ncbi:21 kDa protein-like [Nymphaea colorata]|nr:21 kDa protein-like [Nymphaea colorata]
MELTVAIIFLVLSHAIFPVTAAGGTAGGGGDATEFIRTSCKATRWPAICFSSLSAYAGSVQQSPSQLARVAISVSLSKARTASGYVGNLSANAPPGCDPRSKMALHDCSKTFKQAIGLMAQSLDELRYLYAGNFRWRMSNIQTWMSAALTNEQTCVDGFEGVTTTAALPIKSTIANKVSDVSKVTSNALALVNCLAAKHGR